MLRKYKNVSDTEQVIVGVGTVVPGQEFQSHRVIENPNIQVLSEVQEQDNKITGVSQSGDNAVTEAEQVKTTEEIIQ